MGTWNRAGNLVSQGVNSLGSLVWVALVARNTPVESFGFWALLYTFATTLLQISRTAWGTLLLVSPDGSELQEAEDGEAGLNLSSALAVGLVFLLLAAALYPQHLITALVFAALLPAWLLHDAVRMIFMRHGRGVSNALIDVAWVVPLVALALLLERSGNAGTVTLTCARIVASTIALAAALLAWRRWPSLHRTYRFTRTHLGQLKTLTLDATLASASGTLLPLALAALLGLAATASLRGAHTLLGGVALLVMALMPMATVRMAHLAREGDDGQRFLRQWSFMIAASAGIYGAFVMLLPDSIGRSILGDSWESARAIVLPLVLQAVLRGPQTGIPILLRAQSRLEEALRLRFTTSMVNLAVPMVGTLIWGLPGAAWGILVATVVVNIQYMTHVAAKTAPNA